MPRSRSTPSPATGPRRDARPRPNDETFHLLTLVFNVTMALEQLATVPPRELKIHKGMLSLTTIDRLYASTVELKGVAIVATLPGRCGSILIDANHRIARALDDGLTTFPGHVLTVEQSRGICANPKLFDRLKDA
jgi:hypothetical protein